MTEDATTDERSSLPAERTESDARPTVEVYEADDGTVFFDAENPLAWVQSTETVPIEQ